MALGAIGITCQKLGEAEAMADGRITDIFIPYNILGATKLARLHALHQRITLSVTADSLTTITGYATRFADPSHPLRVLIECDTGALRCGVTTPHQAVELALAVTAALGLSFAGLMTYPPRGGQLTSDNWMADAVALLNAKGLTAEASRLAAPPTCSSRTNCIPQPNTAPAPISTATGCRSPLAIAPLTTAR